MGRHGGGTAEEDDPTAPWDRPRAWEARQPRLTSWFSWGARAGMLLLVLATGVVGWRFASSAGAAGPQETLSVTQELRTTSPAERGLPTTGKSSPDEASGTGQGASTTPGGADSSASGEAEPPGTAPGATQQLLVVHVVGAVKRPGVYRLPEGSRVQEAIAAAGGAARGAQVEALNLAALLQDGTQIRVLKAGEESTSTDTPAATGPAPLGGAGAGATPPGVVRLNSASAAELESLPGVGPALSARLIEFRESHGAFRSLADLDAVPGIGPAMLSKLEALVSFD